MTLVARINNTLQEIYLKDRLRSISGDYNINTINLSSNDYLGLACDHRIRDHLKTSDRVGCSASRVLCGNLEMHVKLETALAECTGMESSLLFGSGYLANIGVLSSLPSRNDMVISDKYIHASLIDGIHLSRARHVRANHNDLNHFEMRLKQASKSRKSDEEIFLVTESVFSMDGDIAPLSELYSLSELFDATLVIDEAHAMGVFGANGGGVFSGLGLGHERVILLGTLSKSLASYGGFVCGQRNSIEFTINSARSFLFSTALPEVLVRSSLEALNLLMENPQWGETVHKKAKKFIQRLVDNGIRVKDNGSQIVPVFIGSEKKTMHIQKRLAERGILVSGIRPPTVPEGTSRLRCSVSRIHSDEDLLSAADGIAEIISESENL